MNAPVVGLGDGYWGTGEVNRSVGEGVGTRIT